MDRDGGTRLDPSPSKNRPGFMDSFDGRVVGPTSVLVWISKRYSQMDSEIKLTELNAMECVHLMGNSFPFRGTCGRSHTFIWAIQMKLDGD